MPTALVNGLNLYYESHGSGFPLVFAYGLGGNTTEWEPQIPVFSKDYRFIVWDPRGHGRSDAPPNKEDYTLDIFASDLAGLLDHLAIQESYIGGLSMGAGVAARFALAHPQRVAGLLIFDSGSASGLPVTPEARRMREDIIRLAETQGMDAVAEHSMRSNPNISRTAESGPAARQRILDMYRALSAHGYAHSTRMILNSEFDGAILGTINSPTLVLAGDEDSALASCRYIHQQISGSEMVVIPSAGHLSNLDQPQAFNNAVLSFLRKADQTRKAGATARHANA